MFRKAFSGRTPLLMLAALSLLVCLAWQADARTWHPLTPIEVAIDAPDDNSYHTINKEDISLTATASDTDCYTDDWETWYTYEDDITSGTTSTTYHLKWTRSGGGVITQPYGTSSHYDAPAYSLGAGVRSVNITATADDLNRPGDTGGYNETAKSHTHTVKIWQIEVTKKQSGQEDSTCNLVIPAIYGGIDLGERDWGDTVNIKPSGTGTCECFNLNTQITGTIPSDAIYDTPQN